MTRRKIVMGTKSGTSCIAWGFVALYCTYVHGTLHSVVFWSDFPFGNILLITKNTN
jgi:hypothetical protein